MPANKTPPARYHHSKDLAYNKIEAVSLPAIYKPLTNILKLSISNIKLTAKDLYQLTHHNLNIAELLLSNPEYY